MRSWCQCYIDIIVSSILHLCAGARLLHTKTMESSNSKYTLPSECANLILIHRISYSIVVHPFVAVKSHPSSSFLPHILYHTYPSSSSSTFPHPFHLHSYSCPPHGPQRLPTTHLPPFQAQGKSSPQSRHLQTHPRMYFAMYGLYLHREICILSSL